MTGVHHWPADYGVVDAAQLQAHVLDVIPTSRAGVDKGDEGDERGDDGGK